MPELLDSGPTDVNGFIDWLYGKEENSDASIAAVANFVRSHVQLRPAGRSQARWPDIRTMRQMAMTIGPSVTAEEFDAALVAFVAS